MKSVYRLTIILFSIVILASCQTTYKVKNCSYYTNPTEGNLETKDAKVDDLPPSLSGLVPKFIFPRKIGRIYISFSKSNDGQFSLNANTFFSALIDDLDRIKPENKLVLTLNDSTKIELSPREERLGTDVPEAVYLISPENLDKIIFSKKMIFDFSYTTPSKKSKSKKFKVNNDYLSTIQQRANCIRN